MTPDRNGLDENSGAQSKESRRYFFQIPNIIFELRLNAYDIALFSAMARTAGENGRCWRSTRNLASMSGMSVGTVSKSKKTLARPFQLLNGKALIQITKRRGLHGGRAYDEVTIVDIWAENEAHYAKQNNESCHHARLPVQPTISTGEIATSVGELATSLGERKKISGRKHNKERKPPYPLSGGGINLSAKIKRLKSRLLQLLGQNPSRAISNAEERALRSTSIELTDQDFVALKYLYGGSKYSLYPPWNLRKRKLSTLARDLPQQIQIAESLCKEHGIRLDE